MSRAIKWGFGKSAVKGGPASCRDVGHGRAISKKKVTSVMDWGSTVMRSWRIFLQFVLLGDGRNIDGLALALEG
eukprot:4041051-Pyramimonas_sp.AAC.1